MRRSRRSTDDASTGRDPLQVNLRRLVWLILLIVILPTALLTGIGGTLLILQRGSLDVLLGILSVSFAVSVLAGATLLMILAGRGARIARVQSTFLSRMGHELRTPLAGIRLHAQLLASLELPPDARASVDAVSRETDRLTELVERILRWREIRSRTHLFKKKRTTPRAIIDAVISGLPDPSCASVRWHEPLPELRGDPDALAEAIRNLVSNAVKYAPDSGPAEIDVRRFGRRLIFAVSDRGPGLPEGPPEQIFEAFYRAPDPGKPDPGGSGLGLAIARQIVQAHGGRIGVASRAGGGCRFLVSLPYRGEPS